MPKTCLKLINKLITEELKRRAYAAKFELKLNKLDEIK